MTCLPRPGSQIINCLASQSQKRNGTSIRNSESAAAGSSVVIAIYILFFLPQNIHAKVPKFAWHLNSGRNYSKNVNHFCCYSQPAHTDSSNHTNIRTSPVTAKVSTVYQYLLIYSFCPQYVQNSPWVGNDKIMANWLKMNPHSCSCFLLLFYSIFNVANCCQIYIRDTSIKLSPVVTPWAPWALPLRCPLYLQLVCCVAPSDASPQQPRTMLYWGNWRWFAAKNCGHLTPVNNSYLFSSRFNRSEPSFFNYKLIPEY